MSQVKYSSIKISQLSSLRNCIKQENKPQNPFKGESETIYKGLLVGNIFKTFQN